MADTFSVNISDGPHQLIRVQLDDEVGYHLFHFEILFHDPIGSIRDIVHYHIEVHFVRFVSIGVKTLPHLHTVGVVKHLEDRQLTVLVSFILEDLLDSYRFASFSNGGLEHHTERSISNYFFGVIGQALLLLFSPFIGLLHFVFSNAKLL